MKILFKNANILDVENGKLFLGNVIVTDNIISFVGTTYPNDNFDEVIDCKQNILMPGFVDAHCHSPMTILRGVGADLPLKDWLFDKIIPLENKLTPNDIYWGEKLAILEYLAAGITTVEECYFDNEQIIKALSESGMRARVGFGPSTRKTNKDMQTFLTEQLNMFQKVDHKQIKPCLYIHSIYTSTSDEIENCVYFSAKNNLPMSIHLSETLDEVGNCTVQNDGLTPPQYLESLGFFDRNTLCYHCVHMDKDDLQILADYNSNICTCPSSNIKLASGIAPIYAMQNKGINIAIGTDGVASNNSLDMFKEMFLVSTLAKVSISDASAVKAQDVLKMATKNGSKALGFDCGEIVVGKTADLIIIDIHKPHMYPHSDLLSHLVYSAKSSDVVLTMINGRILYKDGVYTNEDAQLIYNKINEIRERLTK